MVDISRIAGTVFGSVMSPVRAGAANLLLNSPDGWVADQGRPVWWIGSASPGADVTGTAEVVPGPVERATALTLGPLTAVLPWRVYRGNWRGDADAEALDPPLWMVDPMLCGSVTGEAAFRWPVPGRITGRAFWGRLFRHALWFGRGYFTYQESASGAPTPGTLLLVNPFTVSEDPRGFRFGEPEIATDEDGRYGMGGRTWRLVRLQEPGLLGDGSAGVMGRHGAELGLSVQLARYTSGTFASGVPAGYLKASAALTQDDADRLKQRWMESNGGDRRTIAVLSSSIDFQPISIKPVDAQLTEVDDMVIRRVAHCFNLSARALDSGAAGSNSYANITDERQDRIDDTHALWRAQVEDTVTALLPYGQWLELDTRGYLMANPAVRTAYYQAGLSGGWLSPDEVRPLERLPGRAAPAEGDGDAAA